MQLPLTPSTRRRLIAVVAIAGLLVAAIVGIASATADHAKRSGPSLRMIRQNPATVAGRGFKPHRRVHVRLVTDERTLSRRPLANRAGAFTAQFSTVIDRCSAFTVTASQQNHLAVVLRSPARPACAPAGTP
jgi:hypothetical protein